MTFAVLMLFAALREDVRLRGDIRWHKTGRVAQLAEHWRTICTTTRSGITDGWQRFTRCLVDRVHCVGRLRRGVFGSNPNVAFPFERSIGPKGGIVDFVSGTGCRVGGPAIGGPEMMGITQIAVPYTGREMNSPQEVALLPDAFFVNVDFVLINYCVKVTETGQDKWGRPQVCYSVQSWASWWGYYWLPWPSPSGIWWVPAGLVDRGWIMLSQLKSVNRSTEGWIFETDDGIFVVAAAIVFIVSDRDVELKWRPQSLYMPFTKR